MIDVGLPDAETVPALTRSLVARVEQWPRP
jgi:hypothetical protein